MHNYFTRMLLLCSRISFAYSSYFICIFLVCHACVICMNTYVNRMPFVCHSYMLVYCSYVIRMYSDVIPVTLISLVNSPIFSVRHLCILVTCMCFYHKPWWTGMNRYIFVFIDCFIATYHGLLHFCVCSFPIFKNLAN